MDKYQLLHSVQSLNQNLILNILYAGSGEGFLNSDAIVGAGIFKSHDKGNNWVQLTGTIENDNFKYVNRLVIHPSNENIIVVVTNTGIYKTIDGGLSWITSLATTERAQDLKTAPNDFSIQYATVNSTGIFKSIDAGSTWTKISDSFQTGPFTISRRGRAESGKNESFRIELGISNSNPNTIYAVIENMDNFF